MAIGIGTVLKLIGGSPIGANVSKTFIGVQESVVMIQAQLSGVKNFVSSVAAVVQNPLGAVMSEVQGAVSDAIASIPSIPSLQGLTGMLPEGDALLASASALTDPLQKLEGLSNELSGVTLPNPTSLISAGVGDVTAALGLPTALGVPSIPGFDSSKIIAPLGDAVKDQLGEIKTMMADLPATISGAVDPVAKATELTGILNDHVGTLGTLVSDSRDTLAQAAALHAKMEQGFSLGAVLTAAPGTVSAATQEYVGKIATTAGKTAFGV